MRNPWFPFHTNDWLGNANLKRCSHEEKGIWVDILCLMNDSDTPGCLKWTLKEIAKAIGTKVDKVKRLADKGIIKGSDDPKTMIHFSDFFAQKNSKPIEILIFFDMPGPLWYSSRMVRDHYLKIKRGSNGIKSLANPNVPRSKIDKDTQLLIDKDTSSPSPTDTDADADIKTDVFIKKKTKRKNVLIDPECQKSFTEFWDSYPRHENRKNTALIWNKIYNPELAQIIITDVNRRKVEHEPWSNPKYIPHPSTYLNQERWTDEIISKQLNQSTGGNLNGRNKESIAELNWRLSTRSMRDGNPDPFGIKSHEIETLSAGNVIDGEIICKDAGNI